jgi:methylmalonyl-CoA mutase N-terminal domain/subunit
VTLQAQQPLNNVVRVAIQAMSAVLGGTQSLHTNGYDEALSLPTEEAATLALRTQQIIANESGAALTADPLAGSYYVEHLTNELEKCATELLAKVDELGGAAKAIGASFFQDEIARSAYEYQLRVERGETVIVGVNKYADNGDAPVIPTPDYSTLEREQVERLHAVRTRRDAALTTKRLAALRDGARAHSPGTSRAPLMGLMGLIIDAVRARASVGEIADTLRAEWGMYRPG